MSHIDYNDQLVANMSTPEQWLPATARMTTYLNDLAGRTDISATIGPGVGLGAPACFIPSRAELRIDTDLCLPNADPGSIDPSDALWRLGNPVFMGASAHECGHAAHTRWRPSDFTDTGKVSAKTLDVIMLLEEPRCEHRLLQRARGQRMFLRSTALELILKDFKIPESPYGAAAICALVLARIDGGTLETKDGRAVRRAVAPILLEQTLDKLQDLWREFLELGDRSITGMYSVAKRWLEVLGEDPDSIDGMVINQQDGQPSQQDGSWISSAVGMSAVAAEGAIIAARAAENVKRGIAAGEADAERRKRGARAASDAFAPLVGQSSPATAGRTGERPATEQEQRAATELAARLMLAEQQEAPEIARSVRQQPPGRLRTREASQAAAYRALGLRGRPDMFRSRMPVKDARGPLSAAMMLDISGSMQLAAEAISSAHWVVSHAGARVGARTVVVHFGARVHGIARPGQLYDQVQEYECSDPWENFSSGFLAADHEIDLLDGHGARLLVIASDGQYRRAEEAKFAEAAMTLCRSKGVGVIWLQLTRKFVSNYGFGTVLDMQGRDPVDIAVAVGNAAVAQMERLR